MASDIQINRQTVISFPNSNRDDIVTGISSGSLVVDELLCSNGYGVGELNSNMFEVDLYNIPDINGEDIYVYQNIDEEEVPIFTGRIESCVRSRLRQDTLRHIVAYDMSYYVSDLDVADWWEDVFLETPTISLKNLRKSLCDYVGLSYNDVILPNDNLVISQTQPISSIKFIEVLRYIMTIQACNANISRDGKIEFIVHDNLGSSHTLDDTNYEVGNSDVESFTVKPYTQVTISNTNERTKGSAGTKGKVLVIQDNLLLLNRSNDELSSIATTILNNLSTISYNPGTIKMIISDFDIKLGDLVVTDVGRSIVCEQEMTGSMLIEQSIKSTGTDAESSKVTDFDVVKNGLSLNDNTTKYYRLANTYYIEVLNNYTQEILACDYSVAKSCMVKFQGAVIMDVEIVDPTKECQVVVEYEINDETIKTFTPTENHIMSGTHTFDLFYFWDTNSIGHNMFRVLLTCYNCIVTIPAFRLKALLEGVGLIGETGWDGTITISEELGMLDYSTPMTVTNYTDSVSSNQYIPVGNTLSDVFGTLDTAKIEIDI